MQRLLISDELLKQIFLTQEHDKKPYRKVTEPPEKIDLNDLFPNGQICSSLEIQALFAAIPYELEQKKIDSKQPKHFTKKELSENQAIIHFAQQHNISAIDFASRYNIIYNPQEDGTFRLFAVYKGIKWNKHLGKGTYGVAKIAFDLETGEPVVVKIIELKKLKEGDDKNKIEHSSSEYSEECSQDEPIEIVEIALNDLDINELNPDISTTQEDLLDPAIIQPVQIILTKDQGNPSSLQGSFQGSLQGSLQGSFQIKGSLQGSFQIRPLSQSTLQTQSSLQLIGSFRVLSPPNQSPSQTPRPLLLRTNANSPSYLRSNPNSPPLTRSSDYLEPNLQHVPKQQRQPNIFSKAMQTNIFPKTPRGKVSPNPKNNQFDNVDLDTPKITRGEGPILKEIYGATDKKAFLADFNKISAKKNAVQQTLVMPFERGDTWEVYLKKNTHLSFKIVITAAENLLTTFYEDFLNKGIIHRDLKLENAIIDQWLKSRIVDQGAAVQILDNKQKEKNNNIYHPEIGEDGEIRGTPSYIDPTSLLNYFLRDPLKHVFLVLVSNPSAVGRLIEIENTLPLLTETEREKQGRSKIRHNLMSDEFDLIKNNFTLTFVQALIANLLANWDTREEFLKKIISLTACSSKITCMVADAIAKVIHSSGLNDDKKTKIIEFFSKAHITFASALKEDNPELKIGYKLGILGPKSSLEELDKKKLGDKPCFVVVEKKGQVGTIYRRLYVWGYQNLQWKLIALPSDFPFQENWKNRVKINIHPENDKATFDKLTSYISQIYPEKKTSTVFSSEKSDMWSLSEMLKRLFEKVSIEEREANIIPFTKAMAYVEQCQEMMREHRPYCKAGVELFRKLNHSINKDKETQEVCHINYYELIDALNKNADNVIDSLKQYYKVILITEADTAPKDVFNLKFRLRKQGIKVDYHHVECNETIQLPKPALDECDDLILPISFSPPLSTNDLVLSSSPFNNEKVSNENSASITENETLPTLNPVSDDRANDVTPILKKRNLKEVRKKNQAKKITNEPENAFKNDRLLNEKLTDKPLTENKPEDRYSRSSMLFASNFSKEISPVNEKNFTQELGIKRRTSERKLKPDRTGRRGEFQRLMTVSLIKKPKDSIEKNIENDFLMQAVNKKSIPTSHWSSLYSEKKNLTVTFEEDEENLQMNNNDIATSLTPVEKGVRLSQGTVKNKRLSTKNKFLPDVIGNIDNQKDEILSLDILPDPNKEYQVKRKSSIKTRTKKFWRNVTNKRNAHLEPNTDGAELSKKEKSRSINSIKSFLPYKKKEAKEPNEVKEVNEVKFSALSYSRSMLFTNPAPLKTPPASQESSPSSSPRKGH